MSSGKCVVLSLKRENAVAKWKVIGATNLEEADKGTVEHFMALTQEIMQFMGQIQPKMGLLSPIIFKE